MVWKNNMKNVDEKLDIIERDIGEIKITMAKVEENLRHHIYRTELAEENIKLLREQFEPVETHVKQVEGALKIFGGLSVLVGIIVGIVEVIRFIR